MSKEKIVAGLKKQIDNLKKMKLDIDQHVKTLETHISELQDESKLGVVSDYDYGREKQEESIKAIEKDIKKGVKDIKKTQKDVAATQKKEEQVISSVIDDSVAKE